MRRSRLKDLETVFILGAGASYALSLPATGEPSKKTTPLDNSFNERLLSLPSSKQRPWIEDSKSLIETNWIGELSDYKAMGLEESIIKRLGNYDLLKSIHPSRLAGNRYTTKCENAEYVNHLSHLISELLIRCRQNTKKYAHKFARHVYGNPCGVNKRKHNRIITFNYDTLIDDILIDEANLPARKLYFDRIKASQEETDIRRKSDIFPSPYMVKLHGSINWRIDSKTYEKIINGEVLSEVKPPIWLDRKNIPHPSDDVSPLIMPPLPYKPITTTPIFSHLWQCAFEYLHEAKRIVIAGYSCPQTDSFAMSMLSQLTNNNLEEIVIIDPDSTSLNKYRTIMNKRMRKKVIWTYYGDFVDYVERHSS